MGYVNKMFVEIIDWLYIRYLHITPIDLMKKQYTVQEFNHAEELIEILFDQIEMRQEFAITGNSPFGDRQIAKMGIAQILATQE